MCCSHFNIEKFRLLTVGDDARLHGFVKSHDVPSEFTFHTYFVHLEAETVVVR